MTAPPHTEQVPIRRPDRNAAVCGANVDLAEQRAATGSHHERSALIERGERTLQLDDLAVDRLAAARVAEMVDDAVACSLVLRHGAER